jgi:hypothetical protein
MRTQGTIHVDVRHLTTALSAIVVDRPHYPNMVTLSWDMGRRLARLSGLPGSPSIELPTAQSGPWPGTLLLDGKAAAVMSLVQVLAILVHPLLALDDEKVGLRGDREQRSSDSRPFR